MAHHLTSPLRPASALAAALIMAALLCGCSKPAPAGRDVVVPIPPRDVGAIVSSLRSLTQDANRQTVTDTGMLVDAVQGFLETPNAQTRVAFQRAWLKAHNAFATTRALVITDHADLLFRIDAWPIEPGFIDSLPQYPGSGIVNDFTLKITGETLEQQNGITDSEEVCLGFHPLEYYAFARPLPDFVQGDGKSLQSKVIARRRRALALMAALLDADVKKLTTLMNTDLAAYVPQNDKNSASDDRLVRQVIAGSRRLARHQFREAGLMVDKDSGHGRYSQSSLAALAQETTMERKIYSTSGDLMNVLRGLDAKTAANLDTTLAELSGSLAKGQLHQADRARLPLMFSALDHQFEDLERHLPGTPR